MPPFNIDTFSTLERTLGFGEAGFITQNGALSTAVSAIEITGNEAQVVNHGTVFSSGINAVRVSAVFFNLLNTGSISGTSSLGAIYAFVTSDTANPFVRIVNSGQITGVGNGADGIYIQGGGNEIFNSGLITGAQDDAIQIDQKLSAPLASNRIVNTGTIAGSGSRSIQTDGDADLVFNTGLIIGAVELGGGNDLYDGQGGRVQGRVSGEAGFDELIGGDGAETLWGGADNDTLDGGGGIDMLDGGTGDDSLRGGDGGDHIWGGTGTDQIWGDAGIDYARYDDAFHGDLLVRLDYSSLNTGAAAGDTFFGIEGLVGGTGNDTLFGDGGDNLLFGGDNADLLYGGQGNDSLFGDSSGASGPSGAGADNLWGGLGADFHSGGDSIDYARYDDANHGNLTISLADPSSNTGAAAGDSYVRIEGLVGGLGNDVVIGDSAANWLFGSGGADFIDGLGGNDYLNGGAGADRFRLSTAVGAGNVDIIADFQVGIDDILLVQAIFAAIGPGLTADEFRIGAAADANDYLLYNSATGALTYDTNGNAAGGATQIATLSAGLALTVADFVMA